MPASASSREPNISCASSFLTSAPIAGEDWRGLCTRCRPCVASGIRWEPGSLAEVLPSRFRSSRPAKADPRVSDTASNTARRSNGTKRPSLRGANFQKFVQLPGDPVHLLAADQRSTIGVFNAQVCEIEIVVYSPSQLSDFRLRTFSRVLPCFIIGSCR